MLIDEDCPDCYYYLCVAYKVPILCKCAYVQEGIVQFQKDRG